MNEFRKGDIVTQKINKTLMVVRDLREGEIKCEWRNIIRGETQSFWFRKDSLVRCVSCDNKKEIKMGELKIKKIDVQGTVALLKDQANILKNEIEMIEVEMKITSKLLCSSGSKLFDLRARRGALIETINMLSINDT